MKIVLALVATLLCAVEGAVRFDNYTLYRLTPKNADELSVLQDLESKNLNQYDFWSEPRSVGLPVDILVSPQRKIDINNLITSHAIQFEVLMENIQEKIDEESTTNSLLRKEALGFDWKSYHGVNEINNWLISLSKEHPGKVTLLEGGSSYEGRKILGVKVSFRHGNEKRGIWLDSLIHAREWISGATSTYILNEILTSKDQVVRDVAERYDWYIFPVLNPDGYEFTRSSNRLWRKTRKPYGLFCFGADPNRNWGYKWNTGGSSNQPCSDTYAGPNEFSEIETKTLSTYIESISENLKIYISFHSYSQLLLLPYGHTSEHLDNYDQIKKIGDKAATSLAKRYGTEYRVGNIPEILYAATGSSMDWAKGILKLPVALTYELRDTGNYGFLLPSEQIIPSGEETLDSLITILQESDKII